MLTEILPVELTKDEVRERGQRLAKICEEIRAEEDDMKAMAADARGRIKELEQRASLVIRQIRSGREDREVPVEEREEETEKVTIRLDTGEVVHRRPMSLEERQRPLGLKMTEQP